MGQTESELQPVSCGVPQDSVLGPLLFLMYINDFSNCSEILDFNLFADDANLFYKHKSFKVLELKVQVYGIHKLMLMRPERISQRQTHISALYHFILETSNTTNLLAHCH